MTFRRVIAAKDYVRGWVSDARNDSNILRAKVTDIASLPDSCGCDRRRCVRRRPGRELWHRCTHRGLLHEVKARCVPFTVSCMEGVSSARRRSWRERAAYPAHDFRYAADRKSDGQADEDDNDGSELS